MNDIITEVKEIMLKFVDSKWDLIAKPAQEWLDGKADKDKLISAIIQADKECGGVVVSLMLFINAY